MVITDSAEPNAAPNAAFATFVYQTDNGQLGGYAAVVAGTRKEADEKMRALAEDDGRISMACLKYVFDENSNDAAIIWDGEY